MNLINNINITLTVRHLPNGIFISLTNTLGNHRRKLFCDVYTLRSPPTFFIRYRNEIVTKSFRYALPWHEHWATKSVFLYCYAETFTGRAHRTVLALRIHFHGHLYVPILNWCGNWESPPVFECSYASAGSYLLSDRRLFRILTHLVSKWHLHLLTTWLNTR